MCVCGGGGGEGVGGLGEVIMTCDVTTISTLVLSYAMLCNTNLCPYWFYWIAYGLLNWFLI